MRGRYARGGLVVSAVGSRVSCAGERRDAKDQGVPESVDCCRTMKPERRRRDAASRRAGKISFHEVSRWGT
jgi:hypothetical protein